MKLAQRKLLTLGVILAIGLGLGYLLGYDHGFEKAMRQNKDTSLTCGQKAEQQAREDLKAKYGDALNKEFVLGSPHYK